MKAGRLQFRKWLIGAAVAATAVMAPGVADAHAGDQSYLYFDVADDDLRGRVEMPYADLREVFGLSLSGSDDDILAELEGDLDRLQDYVADHVAVGDGSQTWPMTFEGVTLLSLFAEVPDGDYALFPFTVDLGGEPVPQMLTITFDPFFDEIDGRDALLLIANDWQRGVFDNEGESLLRFTSGSRTQTVDLGDSSQWTNFSESLELGVDHIRTGPDHIFFVLVLLLPSVLVFIALSRSAPTPDFGSALWRILKIVSMFTVAHSITFTLAGLDILPLPPSRLVESIIAASIAAAALHNLRPVAINKEWVLAFVFGLFHGMGFASLVSELEVSQTTRLVSLLGRNVGIEIGQVIVVVLVFPGLFLLRRTRWYRGFMMVASVLLALVSVGWMFERILEIDVGTSDLVDSLVLFPRVLLLVALFTAVCAAAYWVERQRDALLPVYDRDGGDDQLDGAAEERELELQT